MDPSERLEVLEVETVWKGGREGNGVFVAGLWDHDNAADFFDLRVLGR